MSEMQYIDNPAKFLIDTGLLFEINRVVLHPLGLALAVDPRTDRQIEGAGAAVFHIWDNREDREGIYFADKTFKEGTQKVDAYMDECGGHAISTRLKALGFVVQDKIFNPESK